MVSKRWICLKGLDRRFLLHMLFIWVLTFLIFLPLACRNVKYSWYNILWKRQNIEKARDFAREENNKRITMAREYLTEYKKQHPEGYLQSAAITSPENRKVDVGITIITVSRNRHRLDQYEPYYLTQVASTFLRHMNYSKGLQLTYSLFLCNVDPHPNSYTEIKSLSKIIPVFQKFEEDVKDTLFWPKMTTSERLEKEKKDYVFCGKETLKRNASNVFLVEDDAMPHADLLPVVDGVLRKHVIDQNNLHRTNKNVTFIKFYHPDRLLGYVSLEAERIPELLALAAILASALTFVYTRVRPVSRSYYRCMWCSFFLYCCLVLLFVGRQSFLELRRFSHSFYEVTPAAFCCTPGMLYTRKGMQEVIDYLSSITCKEKFGKDIALAQFMTSNHKTSLMVQPNLFTHIGMYSTLRNNVLDPVIV